MHIPQPWMPWKCTAMLGNHKVLLVSEYLWMVINMQHWTENAQIFHVQTCGSTESSFSRFTSDIIKHNAPWGLHMCASTFYLFFVWYWCLMNHNAWREESYSIWVYLSFIQHENPEILCISKFIICSWFFSIISPIQVIWGESAINL